mmetsp:Transcript_68091/g.101109  ORF Transcript_68091/g.101109 Transcript_68091/m.101109 type:complete len:83 (+) Transcript_68091:363-611(+)
MSRRERGVVRRFARANISESVRLVRKKRAWRSFVNSFFNDFSFCVSTSSIVSESIGAAARLENMRELDIIRDDVGFCVEAAV